RLTDPNHIFHQPLQKNKHSQIAAHSRAKSCALPLLIQKLIPQWQICKVFKQERDEFEKRLRQSQKLESIGTLAGGIAHDFNNILSAVLGYTELALEEVDKGTRLAKDLREVYRAGIRARDLVKQILAFARKREEELRPTKVITIAKEALKLLR
ncbi:MAG: histidine kinase dimerization/phospho-acceptor domain-containing protein, partial [Desulfoferrobacter sp.]